MHRPLGPFVLFALALACGTEGPLEPPHAPAQNDATAEANGARRIGVLSRNLYLTAHVAVCDPLRSFGKGLDRDRETACDIESRP